MDADSSSAGTVKLNEPSLTLESSRTMGSGVRVPLRFDTHVKVRGARKGRGGVGFFPGAIVALRGKNGGGGWFHVSEVLTVSVSNSTRTSRSIHYISYQLRRNHDCLLAESLSLLVLHAVLSRLTVI